jgi:hypothetical protein
MIALQENARVLMEIVTLVLADPIVRLRLVEIVVILTEAYIVVVVVEAEAVLDVILQDALHLHHGWVVEVVGLLQTFVIVEVHLHMKMIVVYA